MKATTLGSLTIFFEAHHFDIRLPKCFLDKFFFGTYYKVKDPLPAVVEQLLFFIFFCLKYLYMGKIFIRSKTKNLSKNPAFIE